MWKLRSRERDWRAQVHAASTWQSQDLNQGSLIPGIRACIRICCISVWLPRIKPHFLQRWLLCSNWFLEYSFPCESVCPELIPRLTCSLPNYLSPLLPFQTDPLGQKHWVLSSPPCSALQFLWPWTPEGLINLWMHVQLPGQLTHFHPCSQGSAHIRQRCPAWPAEEDHDLVGFAILFTLDHCVNSVCPPHLLSLLTQQGLTHTYPNHLCFFNEKKIPALISFFCTEFFKEQIEIQSPYIFSFSEWCLFKCRYPGFLCRVASNTFQFKC